MRVLTTRDAHSDCVMVERLMKGLLVNVWSGPTGTTRVSAEPTTMRCLKEQEEGELAEAGNELCAKDYR